MLRCSGYCNAGPDLDELGAAVSLSSVGQALMAAGIHDENRSTGMFDRTLERLRKHRSLESAVFIREEENTGDAKTAWNNMEVIDMTVAQLEALARRIEERGWGYDPGSPDDEDLPSTVAEALAGV